MALQHAHTAHIHNTVIHTDSMTAIHSLRTQHSENIHLTHNIHTIARAMHGAGRSVTINWIPSHVGIVGNEKADALAREGVQQAVAGLHIPRTLSQLKRRTKETTETTRRHQTRDVQQAGSRSACWLSAMRAHSSSSGHHSGRSRRCEVVTARIRLGYPYGWQLGIATSDELNQWRCRVQNHTSVQNRTLPSTCRCYLC